MPDIHISSAESLNRAVSALNVQAPSAQSVCKIYNDHKSIIDTIVDKVIGAIPVYGSAASTVIKLALKLLCP